MIIACDFDGTLYRDGQVNTNLIMRLKADQRRGNIVILWTCRNGKRLNEALNTLMQYGLKPNFVNENAPITIKTLGYNPRKILADVYIDDKAINVN